MLACSRFHVLASLLLKPHISGDFYRGAGWPEVRAVAVQTRVPRRVLPRAGDEREGKPYRYSGLHDRHPEGEGVGHADSSGSRHGELLQGTLD